MRRRGWALAGAVALAAIFAAVPFAAGAHDDQRLVLTERMSLTGPTTQAGTFASAGAVNDAGAAAATFTVVPKGKDRGKLTGTHVLTGSAGTITIETRATVVPFPPPTPPRAFARGKWWIVGATGAYAGMRGRGRITAVADFTNGQITIMREGKVKR